MNHLQQQYQQQVPGGGAAGQYGGYPNQQQQQQQAQAYNQQQQQAQAYNQQQQQAQAYSQQQQSAYNQQQQAQAYSQQQQSGYNQQQGGYQQQQPTQGYQQQPAPVDQGYQQQQYDQPGAGYDFMMEEERNGIRFSWNEWPHSKIDAERAVVPVGCLYTPLKQVEGMPILQYDPVRCKNSNCMAVLNPWCQTDIRSKLWTCPFCLTRNGFPPHYAENITEVNLPAELIPQYTTIEYELPHREAGPPVFLFVVDVAINDDELESLKDAILQSLSIIPENALIGLITFGLTVHVHELGFQEASRSYVFRGDKDIASDRIHALLGLPVNRSQTQQGQHHPPGMERFLLPVKECLLVLDTILSDLTRDPWPTTSDKRAQVSFCFVADHEGLTCTNEPQWGSCSVVPASR